MLQAALFVVLLEESSPNALSFRASWRTLQRIAADGETSTEIPQLDHLILREDVSPNFALLQSRVCLSNSPTFNLMLVPGDPVQREPDRMVPMSPTPPLRAVTISAGDTLPVDGLSGKYNVKVSYAVKDFSTGTILAESPLGPEVETHLDDLADLDEQELDVSSIPIPNEPGLNCRRIYRTLTGASATYYHWQDIDDIETTSLSAAVSDEVLAGTPAPTLLELGNPPGSWGYDTRLQHLTAWRGRLFGVAAGSPTAERDTLRWSEVRSPDRWPAINSLPIPPVDSDEEGITALIARRNSLGIGKHGSFHILNDPNNTTLKQIASIDVISHQATVVHDDTAWMLCSDGMYQWDQTNRVMNISRDSVHGWFTTDTYFERSAFDKVVGVFHEGRQSIIWLMPSANQDPDQPQTNLDRWIEYYPEQEVWLGPHRTSEFTPTSLGILQDDSGHRNVAFGGANGRIYQEHGQHFDGDTLPTPGEVVNRRRSSLILNEEVGDGATANTFVLTSATIDDTLVDGQLDGAFPLDEETYPYGQRTFVTVLFPWSRLPRLAAGEGAGSPATSTNTYPVMANEHVLLLAVDSDGKLLVAASDINLFPITLSAYNVKTGLVPSEQASPGLGVDMLVQIQDQTFGVAPYTKYWGELNLLIDAPSGHNLVVESVAGQQERKHELPLPIDLEARLGRLGLGTKMFFVLTENTTAAIDWFGYHVVPVNIVGRRTRG